MHHRQALDQETALRMVEGQLTLAPDKELFFHKGSGLAGSERPSGRREQGGTAMAQVPPASSLRGRLCVRPPHGASSHPPKPGLTTCQRPVGAKTKTKNKNPKTKKITTVQDFDPTTLTAECPFHLAMKDESGPLPGKEKERERRQEGIDR